MAAKPPPPLLKAIQQASAKYGIPVSTMVGIWRIESGSSYPNPYVNREGYGGLFGTTDWNGTPLSQAMLSASILARLVRNNQGSMSKALLQYSGGGYSSVDGSGGTTSANIQAGGSTTAAPVQPPAPAAQPQSTFLAPPQPGTTVQPPSATPPPEPDVELPGSQSYTIGQPRIVQSLWSQVNQGSFVSPDAALLAANAQASGG